MGMKNIGFLFLLVGSLVFSGCEKYTTPKKLEKKITVGTWRIAKSSVNGQNITSQYNGYLFKFDKNGGIAVSGAVTTSGSWYSGEDKNPVTLYLSFPVTVPQLYMYSDDWIVTILNNSECYLERKDKEEDVLIFRKVGK